VTSALVAWESSGPVYFRKCVKDRKLDVSACAARGTIGFLKGRQGITGDVCVVRFRSGPEAGLLTVLVVGDETPTKGVLKTLLEAAEREPGGLIILSQQSSTSLFRTVLLKTNDAGILFSSLNPYRPFCFSVHS
ncbi:hypothetical protein KCU75_g10231, partial [Aureobasidium melanogenum]